MCSKIIANFSSPPFLGASISESQQPDHLTRRAVQLTKPTGNGHLHKLNYKKICSFLNRASICLLERLFLSRALTNENGFNGFNGLENLGPSLLY